MYLPNIFPFRGHEFTKVKQWWNGNPHLVHLFVEPYLHPPRRWPQGAANLMSLSSIETPECINMDPK